MLDRLNTSQKYDAEKERSLLWIDDFAPIDSLGAGFPRARAIVLMAAKLGWRVTIYPFGFSGMSQAQLTSAFPPEIRLIDEGRADDLYNYLQAHIAQFDTVMVSRKHNRLLLESILAQEPNLLDGCRFIYDSEALMAERIKLEQMHQGAPLEEINEEALIQAEIDQVSARVDVISCVSTRERAPFHARTPTLKEVFVLNLPLRAMQISPKFDQRSGLLFVGRLMEQDSPNWLGLVWFLRSVWPLVRQKNPSMTLTIAGRYIGNDTPIQMEGIKWLGGVEDLQPYYDQARLFIAPVFIASGIPLKVVNAVAAGLPVIGTERMAELLQWPSSALPTANTALDFSQLILDLYEDELRWDQVQKSSQALISDTYSVESFEKNLLKILGC